MTEPTSQPTPQPTGYTLDPPKLPLSNDPLVSSTTSSIPLMAFEFVVPWPNISDPNYGGVPDICDKLGYPLIPIGDRKSSTFAQATANYRKLVNVKFPNRHRCPLDASDPEALSYGRGFLEENKSKFERSELAEQHGWPIYPQDEEKIVTLLAKLMATQECYWRRNQNYFQRKDAEREFEANQRAKNPKDLAYTAYSRPARSTPSDLPQMTDEDRDGITGNINDHLNWAYPMNSGEDMDTDWLFKPLKLADKFIDPYEVDPYAMRYLHERSLYNTRDRAKVDQFVEDTIKHYVLARENKEWEYRIRQRCKHVIKEFAKSWKAWEKGGYGFLESVVGLVGQLQKTPEFEKKWGERRLLWLNQVHQGKSAHIIEWNNNPEILYGGSGSKRSSNNTESTPGSQHADKRARLDQQNSSNGQAKTRSPLKRAQPNLTEPIVVSNSSDSDEPAPDPYRLALSKYQAYKVKQPEGRQAIRTPSSSARASLPANSSKISLGGSRAATASPINSSAPFPSNPSRRSVSGQGPFIPLTKPAPVDNTPAYHGHPQAAVNPAVKNIAQQEGSNKLPCQSTPQASQPKRMSSNGIPAMGSPFGLTINRVTPKTGRSSSASLKFAIQDETGVPDDEPFSLLSKKQIYEMSIDDLFRTVADKSGMAEASLYQLTFRCQWEPASFIVTKHAGEEPWKRQKKKLNSLFVGAQAEFPDDDEFEVWVLCGDRVTKKKSMEEEVDDDDE